MIGFSDTNLIVTQLGVLIIDMFHLVQLVSHGSQLHQRRYYLSGPTGTPEEFL